MKNLAIIDSYDFNVDFIENIVYILNDGLSKFERKYVSNDEIANIMIHHISQEIINEGKSRTKKVTEHLLVRRKSEAKTRKLAIKIDDDLINETNYAISTILSAGYRKIPSRTMFFRESLNVFYDYFKDVYDSRTLDDIFFPFFVGNVFGEIDHSKNSDTGKISKGFLLALYLKAQIFQFIVDNRDNINKIIESRGNGKAITDIAEGILKIIDNYIKEDYIDDIIKFSIIIEDNEFWIGIPKNHLNDLILQIDPVYMNMDDKVKFLFLLSLIREEFLKIQMKLEILKSNAKMYIKKNAMEFSEIHLMAKALNVIKDVQKTSSSLEIKLKNASTLNDIIVNLNNYDIKHSIANYASPEIIFLNALLINQIFVFGLVMPIDLDPSLISFDSLPQFSVNKKIN